jgi:hypothetical protein
LRSASSAVRGSGRPVTEPAEVSADPARRCQAGLILVTINPAFRLSELEFALAKEMRLAGIDRVAT